MEKAWGKILEWGENFYIALMVFTWVCAIVKIYQTEYLWSLNFIIYCDSQQYLKADIIHNSCENKHSDLKISGFDDRRNGSLESEVFQSNMASSS